MDDPKSQIPGIIRTLCSGRPSAQKQTLEEYFTPDASFSHPLCSVPSFSSVRIPGFGEVSSRWVLWCVYRWYKVLSPKVVVGVDGVEYNPETEVLFLQLHQIFHLFFVPFFAPTVYLTTLLYLTPDTKSSNSKTKYLIKHQEDLYQSTEIVKFFWPGGTQIIGFWRAFATLMCILGAVTFAPLTWMMERGWFGDGGMGNDVDGEEKGKRGEVNGRDEVNGINGVHGRRREKRRTNEAGRKDR